MAQLIDDEVNTLAAEAYERAKQTLIAHRDKLELLANKLMEVESMNRSEFEALMDGEEPPPPSPSEEKTPDTQPESGSGEESDDDKAGGDLSLSPVPA